MRIFGHANPYRHFTLFGEFDSVACEVGEHLAEPAGVTPQGKGHRGVDVAGQFQALVMGAMLLGNGEVVEQHLKVEVEHFQVKPSGFNLGKVEDVVDQAQQGFGAGSHRFGIAPLFVVEIGIQEQTGHADDSVHGRADLVAHAGKKFGLGDAG